jgi:2-polyprenyl-6-methoxyphenol hydroxylase-like FAD-dependent oxidoreductase
MAPQVLIIGGGPSGLFAACELARHGIASRLIERDLRPHRQARGTSLQPATLEVLDRAGILELFLQAGVAVRQALVLGPDHQPLSRGRMDQVDAPWPFQCCLPQWRTEALLTTRLEEWGGQLEHGVSVTAVQPGPEGVRVELRHDDGREEVLDRLSWLIDASGAHSLTRASLREELEGETYPGHYLVAEAGLAEPLLPPDQHVLVVTEAGPLFLGVLPQGRRLVLTEWPPLQAGEPLPQGDVLRPLVGERLGRDPGGLDTSWISCFRMHRRQVPQLAEGHCFLIGDAGHLSSPWGGEGLNAGLMDAADLAWKLALVLRGEAEPALLDTYAIERGMADRHVLEVSDEQHQGIAALVASCAGGVVPTLPALDGAIDRALQARRGMLDVSYAGSPLVGEFLGDGLHNQGAEPAETRSLEPVAGDRLASSPAPGERWPDRCRLKSPRHQLLWFGPPAGEAGERFVQRWRGRVDWCDGPALGLEPGRAGVPQGGAVLIRPDGFIGFRALPAAEAALAALDAHLSAWLRPA